MVENVEFGNKRFQAGDAYPRRALILDDNDANRMLLKMAMTLGHLDHDEAEDGKTALRLWSPGVYAFAFLDIELPDINGVEIAARMRQADDGVAIIMCSTNDDPVTVDKAVHAGADLFFVKPFPLDTLLTMVRIMSREGLRSNEQVLVIDNMGQPRWAKRAPTSRKTGQAASEANPPAAETLVGATHQGVSSAPSTPAAPQANTVSASAGTNSPGKPLASSHTAPPLNADRENGSSLRRNDQSSPLKSNGK